MSSTTTTAPPAPQTSSFFSISNLWKEVGATITGVGLIAGALAPIFSQGAPTSQAGWVTTIGAVAMGVLKAFGK